MFRAVVLSSLSALACALTKNELVLRHDRDDIDLPKSVNLEINGATRRYYVFEAPTTKYSDYDYVLMKQEEAPAPRKNRYLVIKECPKGSPCDSMRKWIDNEYCKKMQYMTEYCNTELDVLTKELAGDSYVIFADSIDARYRKCRGEYRYRGYY